jgi:hypothetical protein
MELFNKLIKPNNRHHLLLLIVMVIYIMFNIQTPQLLASVIDNIYGNIGVLVVAVYLIMKVNPIVGIVALYAAYELIQRSSGMTGSAGIQKYLPSQFKQNSHLTAFNQFPITLEEEVVKQMAPLVETNGPSHLQYIPASDNTYSAMSITDTSSIM